MVIQASQGELDEQVASQVLCPDLRQATSSASVYVALSVSWLTLQPSMGTMTGEALCMLQGASEEVGLFVMMNSTE